MRGRNSFSSLMNPRLDLIVRLHGRFAIGRKSLRATVEHSCVQSISHPLSYFGGFTGSYFLRRADEQSALAILVAIRRFSWTILRETADQNALLVKPPAEYKLAAIGAAPGAHISTDWPQVWKDSKSTRKCRLSWRGCENSPVSRPPS